MRYRSLYLLLNWICIWLSHKLLSLLHWHIYFNVVHKSRKKCCARQFDSKIPIRKLFTDVVKPFRFTNKIDSKVAAVASPIEQFNIYSLFSSSLQYRECTFRNSHDVPNAMTKHWCEMKCEEQRQKGIAILSHSTLHNTLNVTKYTWTISTWFAQQNSVYVESG